MRLLVTGVPRKFLLCEPVTSLREGGSRTHAHARTRGMCLLYMWTWPQRAVSPAAVTPRKQFFAHPWLKIGGKPSGASARGGRGPGRCDSQRLPYLRRLRDKHRETRRFTFQGHVLCGACLRGLLREPVRPAWTPPPQHPQAGGAQRGTC